MVTSRESGKHQRSPVENPSENAAPNLSQSQSIMAPAAPSSKRRTVFTRLAIVGVVATIIGIGFWFYMQGREETDDAYVDGHISEISSRVQGTVQQVFVKDNEMVKQSQPLVELDPTDLQVKVEQATAALEQAKHAAAAAKDKIEQSSRNALGTTTQASADVASMQAQIDAANWAIHRARADIKQAEMKVKEQEAQVRFAEADFERYNNVYKDKVVTKQQFDKAKTSYDIAQAQLQEAENSLQSARDREVEAKAQLHDAVGRFQRSQGEVTAAGATVQQRNIDEEQYRSALAAVKHAEADLKQAQLNLSYCHIIAPVEGRVGRKSVEVGQRVEAGQMLMAVVQEKPWVTANFKETQIGRMHPGQPVEIKIDTFPGRTLKGYIDSLSPASGAKFSMLPPDNATGNFTKVVQRVPVKIVFDEKSTADIADRLSPGMSCEITVFVKQ